MSEHAEDRLFPSGPWTGYYQEQGSKHVQDLELTFRDGVLTGGGWDSVGDFIVKGSYDEATREVRWTKKYAAAPSVYYRGFREGKGIWGTWQTPKHPQSGFHIWPLVNCDAGLGEKDSALREIRASTYGD
jgi:hypothetical protein